MAVRNPSLLVVPGCSSLFRQQRQSIPSSKRSRQQALCSSFKPSNLVGFHERGICVQKILIPLSKRGQRRASYSSIKPSDLAGFREIGIAVRENRSRKKAAPSMITGRAMSSWTGPFMDEESWGGLNAEERDEVVREKKRKKKLIAGVDQEQLLDPHLLADPDSRFAEYYGVQIHHKIARPPEGAVPGVDCSPSSSSVVRIEGDEGEGVRNLPAILLHGFGASLFSWERVMPKLAEVLGTTVLAFDRPAFGLTSRTFPSPSSTAEESKQKFGNAYSVGFSAAAALAFVDFLHSDQAIMIGHSAGSLVAVEAYFQSPQKIAALILVAPALVAPLVIAQIADSKKLRKKKSEVEEKIKKEKTEYFLAKVWAALLWIWVQFTNMLRVFRRVVLLVLNKLLGFLFRSPPAVWLVQQIMDKGGPWAVRSAFYDVIKADKYVLDGYTRPLQCRDWEKALLEYCLALMDNTEDQVSGKKKLQDVTCPVLVITGDTDRFVPDWNSKNLLNVFPNAEFKRIKNCGHLPHEETPDEFLDAIRNWLARILKKQTDSREPVMG